jgi:hypothetical protein
MGLVCKTKGSVALLQGKFSPGKQRYNVNKIMYMSSTGKSRRLIATTLCVIIQRRNILAFKIVSCDTLRKGKIKLPIENTSFTIYLELYHHSRIL